MQGGASHAGAFKAFALHGLKSPRCSDAVRDPGVAQHQQHCRHPPAAAFGCSTPDTTLPAQEGLHRTKKSVVKRELQRFKEARTLKEIHQAADRVHEELMALDIFEAVELTLDESLKVKVA